MAQRPHLLQPHASPALSPDHELAGALTALPVFWGLGLKPALKNTTPVSQRLQSQDSSLDSSWEPLHSRQGKGHCTAEMAGIAAWGWALGRHPWEEGAKGTAERSPELLCAGETCSWFSSICSGPGRVGARGGGARQCMEQPESLLSRRSPIREGERLKTGRQACETCDGGQGQGKE